MNILTVQIIVSDIRIFSVMRVKQQRYYTPYSLPSNFKYSGLSFIIGDVRNLNIYDLLK